MVDVNAQCMHDETKKKNMLLRIGNRSFRLFCPKPLCPTFYLTCIFELHLLLFSETPFKKSCPNIVKSFSMPGNLI